MATSQAQGASLPSTRIIVTSEKVTGPPGAEMLRRALHLPQPLEVVLDNACGGGVMTDLLLQRAAAGLKGVVAADISPAMVAYVQRRAADSAWASKVAAFEALQCDQQSVPLPDATFTHVFSNFGVWFSADDGVTLRETLRILGPGGVAGFTSWVSVTWWKELALPAMAAFVPGAPTLPPDPMGLLPSTAGWSSQEAVRAKLEGSGFAEVEVHEYVVRPEIEAEDFAETCAMLARTMAARAWSAEDNDKFAGSIEGAFLRYLRENYTDGKWDGKMVAIVALGRKL